MKMTSRLRHVLWLVLLVAIIAGAAVLLQDVFDELIFFLAKYEATRPVFGRALFVLMAASSVMLGPFTSAPLMPFAVGVWGTGQTIALLMIGWAFGNAAAYAIGYHLAHPILGRIIPTKKLQKWIEFMSQEVDARLLFLIRLAAPAEIGYAFGILKYDFKKFLLIVIPAELPFALTLTYGGEAFLDGRWHELVGLMVATGALMGVAWIIYRGIVRNRGTVC